MSLFFSVVEKVNRVIRQYPTLLYVVFKMVIVLVCYVVNGNNLNTLEHIKKGPLEIRITKLFLCLKIYVSMWRDARFFINERFSENLFRDLFQ